MGTTIFEAIRSDHDTQRSLVERLTATEGASEHRQELFDELAAELEVHAAAEERYFYVPLMEHDKTQDSARHSVAEHQELDGLLQELRSTEMTVAEWLKTAKQLAERLTHHLNEEEVEVFPVAGKVLSEQEKLDLATDYRHDMKRRMEDLTS